MKNKDNWWKAMLLGGLVIVLSGCSTYRSSFSCGDARGASCMSMERVGLMIESGEIEEYTAAKRRCRGRRCKGIENNREEHLMPKAPDGYKVHHANGENKQ